MSSPPVPSTTTTYRNPLVKAADIQAALTEHGHFLNPRVSFKQASMSDMGGYMDAACTPLTHPAGLGRATGVHLNVLPANGESTVRAGTSQLAVQR